MKFPQKYLSSQDEAELADVNADCDSDNQYAAFNDLQGQALIQALRKELAKKTKQVAALKTIKENQNDEITSLKVLHATLSRETNSHSDLQSKLHTIYEEKLAVAVEEEKGKMHAEFTEQLEEQVTLIKEQSDQVIELRSNEIQL